MMIKNSDKGESLIFENVINWKNKKRYIKMLQCKNQYAVGKKKRTQGSKRVIEKKNYKE